MRGAKAYCALALQDCDVRIDRDHSGHDTSTTILPSRSLIYRASAVSISIIASGRTQRATAAFADSVVTAA